MRLASAGGKVDQQDGRIGTAMAAIVGHDGPEIASLGGLAARVQHRRACLIHEDAVRAAQMSLHVVDRRHEVEAGAADPVAKRATIEMDALPLEDFNLAIEGKMIAEF